MTVSSTVLDPWYTQNLVCPRDLLLLRYGNGQLTCSHGHCYPVVDGVPVLLLGAFPQTLQIAETSLQRASRKRSTGRCSSDLYIETLGISDNEKAALFDYVHSHKNPPIDPVVQYLVAATNGNLYKCRQGRLTSYPIPEIKLPPGSGKRLLDLGCSWGRWSIAAALKRYEVVGLDPSLGAVMAARRVSQQFGVGAHFVVADARYLPFPQAATDVVFSYSVLQHLSDEDFKQCVREANRVLSPGGLCCVQMASAFGIRSLYHQARRGFRAPNGFDVRYRTPMALRQLFERNVGKTGITVDCYFGLGLQPADGWMISPAKRRLIRLSELLRRASEFAAPLKYVADSLYLRAVKES